LKGVKIALLHRCASNK